MNKPVIFGDFEAQRHWMEITFNLPVSEWYKNGTNNDLNYWGIDYPPLTAYHSYFLGYLSNLFDPSWMALKSSHGLETLSHKLFMRISVLSTFWIIYIPALVVHIQYFSSSKSKNINFGVVLLYPGILSIDNGHFQYNHISLGLFIASIICLNWRYRMFGCVLFVLSVNYKQMELYHSLPIAVYLLSTAIEKPYEAGSSLVSFRHLIQLFVVVSTTFAIIWFPFVYHRVEFNVLQRILPISRGLFEDKVANFWSAIDPIIKFRQLFPIHFLVKLSALFVLFAIFPCLLILFISPTSTNFNYSLLITSLGFFLFSFQVHEKSILLAAIPALLFWEKHPFAVSWFLTITNASIFPLCIADGNSIHLALFVFYHILCCLALTSLPSYKSFQSILLNLDGLVTFALCLACICFPVPSRYPHIYILLIAVYSFCHFFLFFIYFNYLMLHEFLYKAKKI